jgi:hypothetical protein
MIGTYKPSMTLQENGWRKNEIKQWYRASKTPLGSVDSYQPAAPESESERKPEKRKITKRNRKIVPKALKDSCFSFLLGQHKSHPISNLFHSKQARENFTLFPTSALTPLSSHH